ncbi:hypothetical protein FPZ12_001690 [Amycolatopsis acidicola]|uniref:DUF6286 domain-containing protein n=1 Tax=Amycolatopsis acidicola TaxID=2596893 RepID=A0A5N0VJG1_9PSEU|nr:DUF6286 domain-containing protein [Amycolatopsis acidicola]KAA9166306.1 hypothetical protein FPZ12_001690 [Amycolatopsis acidicola]
MIRRPRRALAASLTALVGLALCALVATSAIQLLVHEKPVLDYHAAAARLHDLHWTSTPVRIAGIVLAVLGLALLLAALLPGRALVLPLQEDGSTSAPLTSGARRHGMTRTLRASAESLDGVGSAKVGLRRRKLKARIKPDRLATPELGGQVTTALEEQLDRIGPAKRPRTKVKIGRP